MRLIGVLVAVIAAYVWFKRRRPGDVTLDVSAVPLRPVPTPAPPVANEPEQPTDARGGDVTGGRAPEREDTGGLDASAGWDDLQGGPAAGSVGPLEEPTVQARQA